MVIVYMVPLKEIAIHNYLHATHYARFGHILTISSSNLAAPSVCLRSGGRKRGLVLLIPTRISPCADLLSVAMSESQQEKERRKVDATGEETQKSS